MLELLASLKMLSKEREDERGEPKKRNNSGRAMRFFHMKWATELVPWKLVWKSCLS